jgi:hypothetical protein
VVHGLRGASAAGHKSAGNHRPLRHRVDLSVGAAQRSQQQDTAPQVGGIARGRHRGIDVQSRLGKRRQVAVTITAAVFLTRIAVGETDDAHPLQDVGEALVGENGLLLVAGPARPTTRP